MEECTSTPRCPGCHFGCALDAYRCGRGKGFSERWRAGESIPERGEPPMMRGGGGAGKDAPPAGARVMHGLNIMANVLQSRHAESAGRKVLASIFRQGGFFSVELLAKRTLIDQPQLDDAVASLMAEGLIVSENEPVAGSVLRITPEGMARQSEWNAEQEAATADFLSPLSDDEQVRLADFLFRLIVHARNDACS